MFSDWRWDCYSPWEGQAGTSALSGTGSVRSVWLQNDVCDTCGGDRIGDVCGVTADAGREGALPDLDQQSGLVKAGLVKAEPPDVDTAPARNALARQEEYPPD